ncbi:MAG TPA: hypothetical protein VNA89_05095 [Gemmatimonadaceae bacterium]|nr:hypothetical protein [Gemmatimonadaceae bacterium]
MTHSESWRAEWEGAILHIRGVSDLYPDDFSTASLMPDPASGAPHVLAYRIAFARDKEHFSSGRVGPVDHWEHHVPAGVRIVRILTPAGEFVADVRIPGRAIAT